MATVPDRPLPMRTIGDLLDRLGGISAKRVRLRPSPGKATERDLEKLDARGKTLCELVDGALVEKAVGARESLLAIYLSHRLFQYLEEHPLGILLGESGGMRLWPGLIRMPDLSFISWDRLPKGELPDEPFPHLAPDLAVEVLSKSNTRKEMQRKVKEYFQAGVRLVWLIHPNTQTADVYHSSGKPTRIEKGQFLEGEEVLPGFSLPLKDLFSSTTKPGGKRPRN